MHRARPRCRLFSKRISGRGHALLLAVAFERQDQRASGEAPRFQQSGRPVAGTIVIDLWKDTAFSDSAREEESEGAADFSTCSHEGVDAAAGLVEVEAALQAHAIREPHRDFASCTRNARRKSDALHLQVFVFVFVFLCTVHSLRSHLRLALQS
eukprot:scaffold7381_cov310-Pinguiococcus_pyrenoidosus.AAC.133